MIDNKTHPKFTRALKAIGLTIGTAALLATTTAQAHGNNDHVIDARRGYFQLIGLEMAGLAAMAKGDRAYDAAVAEDHAATLLYLTQYPTARLFAPGTSKEDVPGKTRALPAIWQDMSGLGAKSDAFVTAVKALQDVAGEGLDALRPAVGQLGGTCKACHDDFRAKDF